jgi:metal-dependent amidase/aminoacylase/carboxypeptidase family protein
MWPDLTRLVAVYEIGRTGAVGVLRNGEGQTVLARADMDALPVRENTGLPYASTRTAASDAGETVCVSHACGHDAHVTCLLGAAELLAKAPQSRCMREEWASPGRRSRASRA